MGRRYLQHCEIRIYALVRERISASLEEYGSGIGLCAFMALEGAIPNPGGMCDLLLRKGGCTLPSATWGK